MDPLQDLIGRGPKMTGLRAQVRALLSREGSSRLPPILITGETGTGKGLLARTLHRASARSASEFVELNGYERGAFTDARQSKAGLLLVANRGTLFLDEVALLPLSLQAKLLKVLEDGRVRRLGSTRSEPFDAWIISATNGDLPALVRARRFREDLYHRLAVITLGLPPLRELGEDLDVLTDHALARGCEKYALPLKELSPEARSALRAYRWPGNVRELNSVIERAVLLCPTHTIPDDALDLGGPAEAPARDSAPSPVDAAAWEQQHLGEVL